MSEQVSPDGLGYIPTPWVPGETECCTKRRTRLQYK